MTTKLFAADILLDSGWHQNKTLHIEDGIISKITDGKDKDAYVANGAVIPGMINCHSHAFQRGFAGFSEQGSEQQDSFWTWRKVMYQFLDAITPVQAQIIAQQLYIEMLKAGYTRVAEFHYLHHDVNGQPYAELATMSKAIFDAANNSGIGLTMLPVLYQYSGFGELPPTDGQKRFVNSTAQFNQLVTACFELSKNQSNANVGIAPHSLRAVNKSALETTIAHVRSLDNNAPIHIHISEQQQEVRDCFSHYEQRPVQWLLDNVTLDQHWCLIHATHINQDEVSGIIASKAIAGICPTTEANLGDGIFPTDEFMQQGGQVAIGSDSHISVSVIEEIKLLEYAQRLSKQQRAMLASKKTPSVGQHLWQHVAQSGALTTNSNTGCLAEGKQADLLVIDPQKMRLYANDSKHFLDSLIFASNANPIKDVMVNGHWVIVDGKHRIEEQCAEQFARTLTALTN